MLKRETRRTTRGVENWGCRPGGGLMRLVGGGGREGGGGGREGERETCQESGCGVCVRVRERRDSQKVSPPQKSPTEGSFSLTLLSHAFSLTLLSLTCTYVVDWKMGVRMAPDFSSGVTAACTSFLRAHARTASVESLNRRALSGVGKVCWLVLPWTAQGEGSRVEAEFPIDPLATLERHRTVVWSRRLERRRGRSKAAHQHDSQIVLVAKKCALDVLDDP